MTVENETSKTDKLVMGSKTYDFGFNVLLEDPTEEDAQKAIRCTVSDGLKEIELKYGTDYSVELDKDKKGGVVTVVDPKTDAWTIIVYRQYAETQGSDYKDYDSFPAETLEANIDKSTMILQQHKEKIDRCVKVSMLSDTDPEAIIGYVERVNDSIDNIDIVADNINNVNSVALNIENVLSVDTNKANINTVSGQILNVVNVSDNMNNILSVDENETNINTTVDNLGDIKVVVGNVESINTVAANAEEVANVSDNMESVLDAPKQAQAAAAEATAALASKREAAASQTEAKQSELKAASYAERVRSEGIPMSVIEQKRSETSDNIVKLWWQDPRDTIIDGFVLSSWKSTTIVKKQGSYPQDVDDGNIVEIVTTRNKYLDNPLVDIQENASEWYYRAFPLSVNGVYNLDKRNSFGVVLYGYRINETDPVPSTRVEYLPFCDNYFYDPCVMDFVSDEFSWGSWRHTFVIPKPCALSYSGVVDYYLNPDNFTLKEDGTASGVSNTGYGGNFMSEFPAIFTKIYKENNYIYVLFSNIKLDDEFECWSCKKADGTYAPNFYLPMFEGTNINNVLRSVATNGKPTSNTNAETEATLAIANGVGWNTTLWADEVLMMLFFPLLFKSTDSQGKLGFGGSASTTGLTVNNDAALTRGLMYGTAGASAFGMTYLGLHNWYGHRWRRPNGLMNANGDIKVKMTTSTVDGSTVSSFNRTGNGYMSTGFRPPEASSSYINRFEPIGNGKFGVVPKAVTGSSTTFYCDGMWTNNGQLNQLILGGSVNDGAIDGVFCFRVADLPSSSHWHYGASPSYHNL